VVDIPGSNYGVAELSLLDWPACCPTMASDGERLAFATCHTMVQKIFVQNVDGSGLKEINSLRTNHGDGACPDPAWSPDGRQLVFANYDYGLNVIGADGADLTQLEPLGLDPVWSPDGQQIAFTAHDLQKGLAIAVMNRDGSQVRLLTGSEAHNQRPAWSPDGQQLAFVSDRDGNREIYVMNSDGRDQRRLTDHAAQDWGPVWSPDSQFIIFTSDRKGQPGIYAINSDGAGETWLMDSDAPPRWPMDRTRVRFVETPR
jgi:TolB protein